VCRRVCLARAWLLVVAAQVDSAFFAFLTGARRDHGVLALDGECYRPRCGENIGSSIVSIHLMVSRSIFWKALDQMQIVSTLVTDGIKLRTVGDTNSIYDQGVSSRVSVGA
jgi:hypothetical protein